MIVVVDKRRRQSPRQFVPVLNSSTDVWLLIPQEKRKIVIEPLQMDDRCINRCGLSLATPIAIGRTPSISYSWDS